MTPNQLRSARTRLGLGTRQLAEICNVSITTIQAIENGELAGARFDAYDKLRSEIAQSRQRMTEHERRSQGKRLSKHIRRTAQTSRRLKGDD